MLNMAVEEIAKVDAACALILMVQELGTLPIQLFGSDELKERFLPRCATGEYSPAFALSEPEAGSDPAGMKTTRGPRRRGMGHQRDKNWITNLGVADFYIVFAVTDRENRRMTAFVVEADRPGFSVGKLEHKLGIRASPTGQPIFEDVRVPQANVIGRSARACRSPWGRSSGRDWERPRRPSGSPRARPTTRSAMRASAGSSARRSTSSRRSSSSSPTWKPAPRPRASCSTRPARWPIRAIRSARSTPRWRRSSAPTPRWP